MKPVLSYQTPPPERRRKFLTLSFRWILSYITLLAWALWLGATAAVFVFGVHFFASLPPASAAESARSMFQAFGPYELILAAVAVLCSGALLATFPSKAYVFLIGCMILASGMTIAVGLGFMPAMEKLREQGRVESETWKRLHGASMGASALQGGILVLTGAVLMWSHKQSNEPSAGRIDDV